MKWLILLALLGCASEKTVYTIDKKCLGTLQKKRFVAPNDVKSMGVFSNLKLSPDGEQATGYRIRIIRRRGLCRGLVMEFDAGIEPSIWSVTNAFECKERLSNVSLVSKLGFDDVFTNQPPEDFYFGLEGKIDGKGNLNAFITFPANDLKNRPVKQRVVLKAEEKDGLSMAKFDWEVIERLKMKKSCFY